MKLDRMEEALDAYARAAAVRPDYAAALCGQGVALHNLGRFAEAMAAFEQAERSAATRRSATRAASC